MPQPDTNTCLECGHASRDANWCDYCGAPLSDNPAIEAAARWLEPREAFSIENSGGHIEFEIIEKIEIFATRRVLHARVADVDGADVSLRPGDEVLIEESENPDGEAAFVIPKALEHLFLEPLVTGSHGEHQVRVYRDTAGMTLEDLVDISNGQITFGQIKDIFLAVLDAVAQAHEAGYLVLAIAPWTVRVEGGALGGRAPSTGFLRDVSDSESHDSADAHGSSSEVDGDSGDELSDWDLFQDDGADSDADALEDTGILSLADNPHDDSEELKAAFVGIERLVAMDEEPNEVPVILGFSPPELLGRVRAELGPTCDVFELGMLLYVLISGRVPPASVYTRYTPALPVRNFRPGFPPGLQPIISRATRPSPADRYPDVASMREAFINACELMERRSEHVGGSDSPRIVMAVDTHVGISKGRRNPTNQDAVFGKMSEDGQFGLMVVADGVSTASYGSGDLASHYLTEHARREWEELLPAYLMDERIDEIQVISKILNAANQEIIDYVNEHYQPFGGNPHEVMGTTALVAVIREGVVTLAALGDSRAYIHNTSGLEQVTVDHNLWTLSILDGITADSALAMPHGDALARCLGTFVIDGGRLLSVPPEPDFFRFALTRGDTLLLTTDGLVDFAGANPFSSEANVHATMLAEPDPALACLELILLANRGGGGDNIGVGVAQFV